MFKKDDLFAEAEIEIPFHDVDVAGIAWHGHYIKYFEVARCKLLDKIDYNYPQMQNSGYFWPVIDIRLRYVKPAFFQQIVIVKAQLVEWENRLKINYQIFDKCSGKKLTKGYSIQVAVDAKNNEMLIASPNALLDKIGIQE